jgi:hypothetical protein
MKTKMNLRQVAAIVILLVAGTTGAFSQVYVTDLENDSVAVGSKARYKVNLYYNDVVNLPAVFNASGVIWTFPAGYVAGDFTQIDGVTALTTGADGAYNQQEIVMHAKAVASGLVLQAQEHSRPIIGTGCIAGNTTTKTIDVVAMPTVASYGADSGGCALPANLLAPVNFTGYGKYDVTLHIAAFDLTNVAIGAPQNYNLIDQRDARVAEVATMHRLTIPSATLNTVAGGAIPAGGCYFVISMTDLQDRISKKTLGYVFGTTEVANANPDGANQYRYFVYPVPTTQPIQHIQNMY